jgi:hypothetical protein
MTTRITGMRQLLFDLERPLYRAFGEIQLYGNQADSYARFGI